MEGMEEKLGAILGNPDMMKQIMSMAQALGSPPPPPPPEKPKEPCGEPGFDPAMIQNVMTLVRGTGIDSCQQNLLCALEPYLTRDRISRLERAMRAAKLAGLAAQFLGGGIHV